MCVETSGAQAVVRRIRAAALGREILRMKVLLRIDLTGPACGGALGEVEDAGGWEGVEAEVGRVRVELGVRRMFCRFLIFNTESLEILSQWPQPHFKSSFIDVCLVLNRFELNSCDSLSFNELASI